MYRLKKLGMIVKLLIVYFALIRELLKDVNLLAGNSVNGRVDPPGNNLGVPGI